MHKLLKPKNGITRASGRAVDEVEREIEFERQNYVNRIQRSGDNTEGFSRVIRVIKGLKQDQTGHRGFREEAN